MDDQLRFASLSGDANPLHVDPIAARRLLFGQPVVHGIHQLLWVLDEALATQPTTAPSRILADFLRPIEPGLEVRADCEEIAPRRLRVQVRAGQVKKSEFHLDLAGLAPMMPLPLARTGERLSCRLLTFEEASIGQGAVPLYLAEESAAYFPHVTARCPVLAAELLATSRLVGMCCPGHHSLYTGLELRIEPDTSAPLPELRWKVERADRRCHIIRLHARGPLSSARIDTSFRPQAAEQLSMQAISALVRDREFAGQRALVIGGSRGLGETTAKILAAGGADVRLTYCAGRQDGERVAKEIRDAGGKAEALRDDVLSPSSALPMVSHLYYFATPFIAKNATRHFNANLFARFAAYFVTGFARTIERLPIGASHVFYPSTILIDEPVPGFIEYAAAKSAGEGLCRHLASERDLCLHAPRLPRARTDQTATLNPVDVAEPAALLTPLLRAMNEAPRES